MGKIVRFIESNILPLIRAINENTEEGTYTIGGEVNAPVGGEYYHVMDDDDKNITESNNVSLMGDINNVNTIVFYPHENGFEEGYTEDDINEFEPYYEIDAMDINGDTILCADLTVAELFDYFPESIVNDIIDRESSNSTECVNKNTNEFRIDDIVYRDTTPKDINDVNEVNKIAKRIQTGGESAYLLVDGDVISFYDHIQITNIDGMTPSKFISLGNIRLVVGGGVQLIKRPTMQQTLVLKSWLRNKDKVYLDISKESNYTYPEVICSANYTNVSPNRIVGDILAYFDDGIRPQDVWMESKEGENMNASNLIIESQESKSIAAAKKLVMQRLNYNEQEADEFIRIKLRNDIPSLRTPQGGKFILGVTRMFCDGELRSANDIGNLNSTLKLVASDAHINEYDRNLNNLSCQELVQRFAKAMSDNLEAERDEVNQMVFDSPSDYEIVRIDSFEQAKEYGKYVNWCVAHDAYMFNSYTSDGINQFYFCLKNGFENVAAQPSDGCPLDEYGLSMIAVSVNENGMLNTCTCRWNHDNGGDDSIMNTKQISKTIGMNFFEVFKPNNVWKETLANATQRLANGEDPKTVFDGVGFFKEGFADVRLYRKDNFIDKDGRILSEQWFDKVFSFNEGFARVELNNKCNFINQEGRFLSDQWFNGCRDFRDGFGVVRLNEKYNFISTNGNLLSNQWFDWCSEFNGGFASVELGEKWNYISTDGRLLTSQWFDWCGGFEGGFGGIQADKKYNFVDANGNIISNQWFDSITNFHEGFSGVQIDGKWNFINQYGRIISKVWFDKLVKFQDGLAKVTLDGKFNFISSNGNLISNQWFDSVGSFYGENFTSVEVGNKSNFINRKGMLLSDQWFDECYDFSGGFGEVGLNGKYNFIGQDGKILSNQWFDECYNFVNGFARVKLNGKWNFINQDGKILSNQWFDNCRGFRGDGFAWVSINGRTGEIDANGNLALTETINRKKAIIINENQLKMLGDRSLISENSTDRRVNSIIKKYSGAVDFGEIRDIRSKILKLIPNARAKNDMYLGAVAMWYLTGSLNDASDRFKLNYILGKLHQGVSFGYEKILNRQDFAMVSFDTMKMIIDELVPSEETNDSYKAGKKIQKIGNYTIYRMDSYDDTKYVRNELSEVNWCIFDDDSTFNTMSEGYYTYLCVRDGYENVRMMSYDELVEKLLSQGMKDAVASLEENYPKEDTYDDFLFDIAYDGDETAELLFVPNEYELGLPPCDDYGLSMFVVMISKETYRNGRVTMVYSRYNLPNLYDGDILSMNELSNVIGADAMSVFAPQGNMYESNESLVLENLEYDLFKGNNLKYNAEKGKYLQYYDIEQEKGLEYYEGLLKQIDDERGEIAKKYGVKPNFFILLTRAKNLKPSFSDIRRFVFLCNKRKFVAKEIELIKNKKEFLRQQKEQAESDKKYYEQKRIDNEIIELAKDEYGLTDDFGQAGYILPDGGLLNFGEGGYRESDHRNIEGVYLENNIKIWDDKYRYNYVVDFMNRGAIRCDLNAGLLDMTNEPTDEQYAAIKNFVRYADSISIDFTSDKGDAEHSVYYSNANTQKVVSDIYKYYNEGIRPQGDTWGENKKRSNLIIESQESKSIAAAKRLVMQRLGYDEQEADEFIRIKLRNDIPSLRTPQGGKFILGVTRMFCDGELRTANDFGNLNSTLKLVASDAHINEYDRNLNGMSCQELIQRFAKAMSNNLEAEKDEINKMVFDTPSDYEIVRINSFEQAEEYGEYVPWCVTHDEYMFDSYTNDGFNQFYFCLKNGFENVEKVKSEGCPLDEYGLSMIAVSVNENGMLNTCTCRWNHDNGGDDSVMNAKQVSKVIGMNFFEVFKPNNKWKNLLANAMQHLENGEDPKTVFDGVGFFKEGFAVVKLNWKYNFINQEGRLLSDQWFDYVYNFNEGFARVELNGKCNFINQGGRLLSDQWFDSVCDFSEGFAKVNLNWDYNLINQEGRIISDQWFDNVGYFSEGFAAVNLDDRWNFINQEGKLLSDQWFDDIDYFHEGFAVVKVNGKCNFINKEGRIISDQWFDFAENFREGFARVTLNRKYNFINQEGKLLSDQWFDYADIFSGGFAGAVLNGKTYKIDTNGKLYMDEGKNKRKNIIISENKIKLIKENLEFEVDSSEVDLSSFKKQDSLPSIWKDEDTLDSKVRLKLLDIADDFWEFVNVNWVEPKGIIITGSLCNYNWSDYSDVDLHLIVDFNEIGDREDFVRQYLDSKKNEWNEEHGALKIYGYPVELYVQNIDEDVSAGGIYDLEKNKWIRKPSYDDIDEIDLKSDEIKDEAARIMTIIDDMWSYFNKTNDSHKLELLGNDADNLWRKIKDMRKSSLEDGGEMSDGNIVYKYMRRKKYLDKLFDLRAAIYDKSNTITEGVSYDKFRDGQAFRYRIIGAMIKDGYLFHGTGSEFDEFESDRIRGEERGVYGYGAYFTNEAYKCEEYGNHFLILDANDFEFLNISEKVRPEYNIFKEKLGEFSKIEAGLDNARNNREYDYYSNLYDEYRSTVDTNLLERFVSILEKNGVIDYNNLNKLVDYSFTNIENKDIQKRISQLYLSMGYDGFVCENQFVIFNFNKLNDNIVKDKEALIARYEEGNLSEVKKYIKLLKSFSLNEEVVADGSANGNPYAERWKAEREALKNFISNFGALMQSKEDNKEGRVYKVYYDKLISDLIGYNYCLCVQYDEVKNKPKSTVYVRAYDKFTPFIRRNLQFDDRGLDNQRATEDDIGNSYQPIQTRR